MYFRAKTNFPRKNYFLAKNLILNFKTGFDLEIVFFGKVAIDAKKRVQVKNLGFDSKTIILISTFWFRHKIL